MPSTTITAPVKGFTGSTAIGPTVLDFTDGEATTDVDLPEGTIAYLEANGYGVTQTEGDSDSDGLFDPSAHTVDEVIAYLGGTDGPTVTSDEWERVKAAEAADKNRKGVIEYEPKADDDQGEDGEQS